MVADAGGGGCRADMETIEGAQALLAPLPMRASEKSKTTSTALHSSGASRAG